jgi:cystathionine beta-lyase
MGLFDEVHDRFNTRSVKWDLLKDVFQTEDVLPMWVADMDFQAPQAVNDALIDRAKHGFYGYTVFDQEVKNAIINWIGNRHNWNIESEWISTSPGVINILHMAVQAFTERGDKILIQTPVYTPFYSVIEAHDREVVKNPLIYKDNYYTIDFEDFEKKLKTGVKAFILCSPHNPVGRVWTRNELKRMAELCLQYDVLILSDEIHADLTFPGVQHIPIASLSDEIAQKTITCMAPSKTFNLAGLQASYAVTPNKEKRTQLEKMFNKQGLFMLSTPAITAMEAAYNEGSEWLDELRTIIKRNEQYVRSMFEKHVPSLKVTKMEGTYLLWIDCSALNMDEKALKKFMIEKARVGLNAGVDYGEEGKHFMRMNIACPREILEEGVDRIIQAVKAN